MQCKGVGGKKCGNYFESYSELMNHRRDEHNSGNVICRYFKQGSCHYMDAEEGGCWYLHTTEKAQLKNETSSNFDCASCDSKFKTRSGVMKHRKINHEEEVPECNSISEGKKCLKKSECWFRHPKARSPQMQSHVPHKSANLSTERTTKYTDQDFLPGLPHIRPPDQMEKMLTMLTTVMMEVFQLKKQFQN